MKKVSIAAALILVLFLPALARAQNINFSGTWNLAQIDPPADRRTGRAPTTVANAGAAGDAANEYASSIRDLFVQAPALLVIAQTDSQITVQVGSEKVAYTLDNKPMVTPAGDVNALKTQAHWDGSMLHLHFKKGMNWGRDVLSMKDGKLVVVRDVESGGGSTVFTITYTKAS